MSVGDGGTDQQRFTLPVKSAAGRASPASPSGSDSGFDTSVRRAGRGGTVLRSEAYSANSFGKPAGC